MADLNVNLKSTLNGPGPQHKVKGQASLEFSEGSNGALHTKVTDQEGNPIDPREVIFPTKQTVEVNNFPENQPVSDVDVKAELAALKQQQSTDNQAIVTKLAALETKLNGTLNTQVTGSKVDYVRASTQPRPTGKADDTLLIWDTRQYFVHDGVDWRQM